MCIRRELSDVELVRLGKIDVMLTFRCSQKRNQKIFLSGGGRVPCCASGVDLFWAQLNSV